MLQKIDEPVSVNLFFNSKGAKVTPTFLVWNQKRYEIKQIGLHHTYKKGRTLLHVFSVVCDECFMRLVLNTETLHWRLEEVMDNML